MEAETLDEFRNRPNIDNRGFNRLVNINTNVIIYSNGETVKKQIQNR